MRNNDAFWLAVTAGLLIWLSIGYHSKSVRISDMEANESLSKDCMTRLARNVTDRFEYPTYDAIQAEILVCRSNLGY